MFLFFYYTFGMNLIDILKFEHSYIYNGFIDTTRKKAMTQMKLPLIEGAQEIIEEHKDEKSNFLFGLLKGSESEDQLKNRISQPFRNCWDIKILRLPKLT